MPGISNRMLAIAMILCVLLTTLFVPRINAQVNVPTTFQYNCESHCYGVAYWNQSTETYLGIESYDSVRGINDICRITWIWLTFGDEQMFT